MMDDFIYNYHDNIIEENPVKALCYFIILEDMNFVRIKQDSRQFI